MAISCLKRSPCFDCFPFISCVFFHNFSPHNTTQRTHHTTRVSICFFWFSMFFHTHIHTHAHTRTSARATDRDLASGLSKNVCVNTRKNREICLKKGKSGETLSKARFDIDGKVVRLRQGGERLIEPCRSWFPPKFPHFHEKQMVRGIGNRVVLNLCSNFERVRSCGNLSSK